MDFKSKERFAVEAQLPRSFLRFATLKFKVEIFNSRIASKLKAEKPAFYGLKFKPSSVVRKTFLRKDLLSLEFEKINFN